MLGPAEAGATFDGVAEERGGWPPVDETKPPGVPAETARPGPRPRSPVRWGIGDFVLAVVAGVIGGIVATIPFLEPDGTVPVAGLVASMLGQAAAIIGFVEIIARVKGRGSLSADFGLGLSWRDLGWLPAGVLLSIVLALALAPLASLAGDDAGQEVVKQLEQARGGIRILFAIAVVVVAPFTEELLYRGLLLRSLLRRLSPAWSVFVCGAVFGLVHVVFDPGAYVALPALVVVGCVAALLTVRSGNLSRAILLHAGFNLLTTVQILGHATGLAN